jgi:cellulose synthase/poly-beta-1,6-N-acetylglucosamine synthase-like glycosyltransferase
MSIDALELAFRAHSPRLNPRPATRIGAAFYTAIVAFWMLSLYAAFSASGLLAWAVGVLYVSYDTLLLAFVAWQLRTLWRAPVPPKHGAERPSVGVIVAAYNEAPALAATIEALLGQSDPPERIWLADDGSEDDSASVLFERFGLSPPELNASGAHSPVAPSLHWLRLPHRSKAHALNAALVGADTDVVLTVDADTILAPDAISEVRRAFAEDCDLVVGGGVLAPRCGGGAFGRISQEFQTYEYVRNFLGRYAWTGPNCLLLISGAFAAFRREPVMIVGGFDPLCLVEDYELIHRLHRHAIDNSLPWRVQILGRARALTDAPASVPSFLRQRRRWFAGFLQTQYWNRDLIAAPRFGALGLAMMPVKSLDTLQPIYGLAGSALLLVFLARGEFGALLPATGVAAAKIALDIVNMGYSLAVYRRWTGDNISFTRAVVCLLLEPFGFLILRHLGAAWGWWSLLTGGVAWGSRSARTAVGEVADLAG